MNIMDHDSMMQRLEERDAYWAYREILRLDTLLCDAGIPHELSRFYDGWQIRARGGDAVQHLGSYGASRDRIEVYGFGLRDPQGHLTAEQALEYFRRTK